MSKYKLSFHVENIGTVEFDVTEETYERIADFCKKNYPMMEWKTTIL